MKYKRLIIKMRTTFSRPITICLRSTAGRKAVRYETKIHQRHIQDFIIGYRYMDFGAGLQICGEHDERWCG